MVKILVVEFWLTETWVNVPVTEPLPLKAIFPLTMSAAVTVAVDVSKKFALPPPELLGMLTEGTLL
jgi:hypothetical protein